MTTTILEIRSLSLSYGYRKALDGVDLRLARGEIVCVLGPNGAGKSSLLTGLLSRAAPEQGSLHYAGRLLDSAARRREYLARVGYLGHEPGLFYDLGARENLEFFRGLQRADPGSSREEIDGLLERVGLRDRASESVRSFSRGMKQRLALARVFSQEPELLLADEPLNALDRRGVELFLDLLSEHKARGGAALVVTHSDEPFMGRVDRYVYLNRGRVIADIPSAAYTQKARSRVHEMLYT